MMIKVIYLRHGGILGAADEAVLNKLHGKNLSDMCHLKFAQYIHSYYKKMDL